MLSLKSAMISSLMIKNLKTMQLHLMRLSIFFQRVNIRLLIHLTKSTLQVTEQYRAAIDILRVFLLQKRLLRMLKNLLLLLLFTIQLILWATGLALKLQVLMFLRYLFLIHRSTALCRQRHICMLFLTNIMKNMLFAATVSTARLISSFLTEQLKRCAKILRNLRLLLVTLAMAHLLLLLTTVRLLIHQWDSHLLTDL